MADGKIKNLAVIFKQVPNGVPKAGQDIVVEDVGYALNDDLPSDSIGVEILYISLDPYLRGRMRSAEVKSYFPAFTLGEPMSNGALGRVLKSTSKEYKEGDYIRCSMPFQQYHTLDLSKMDQKPEKVDVENGPEDVRHWLGALGMPGLTAYSGLYEIGKPKKGETIFISSAAGAVGQLAAQISKHEGLKVIGSVGSEEKLKYITEELGFDGAFNYKTEKPKDALARLAPDGVDIYFENVGGEHLEAAIGAMNRQGRIIACGMISQYNATPDELYGVKNLMLIVGKRLTIRGFIVGDDEFGPKWKNEHREKVTAWLKDGSFKAKLHETSKIEQGPEAFIGMLTGENFGKAVLKAKA